MITFPTTPEAFIAHQENGVGRNLSEGEKKLTAAWVEVFNLIYEDGLKQDHDTLDMDLSKLDELMSRHKDSAKAHKFYAACKAWIIEAWRQGAGKGAHST